MKKINILSVRCPNCSKYSEWENNKWKPFCSHRCKILDLGRWACEDYILKENLNEFESYDFLEQEESD